MIYDILYDMNRLLIFTVISLIITEMHKSLRKKSQIYVRRLRLRA